MSKKSKRTRKMSQISNDALSRKNDVYTKVVNREMQTLNFRTWLRERPFKESLLNVRGTQKCLKKHKLCDCFIDSPEYNYGMYGGIPLRSLRHEIEETIRLAHPRQRRRREVKKLLEDGKEDGRLVNYDKVQETLDEIINRNYKHTLFGLTWSPTGFDISRESTGLKLPPIQMSREKSREFLPHPTNSNRLQNRYKTFMLEPSTTRF